MKPSKRYQSGRGKTLKPLCPSCNTYMNRQSIKIGPSGNQKTYPSSWICLSCFYMELDKEKIKEIPI